MLAYASERRRRFQRRNSPPVMLAIVVGHIAVIAVVMSAKMAIDSRTPFEPTEVELIETPPPPEETRPEIPARPSQPALDRPLVIVPVPQPGPAIALDPVPEPVGPIAGPAIDPTPPVPQPIPAILRTGPRFATPPELVRPPYPLSKIDSEEEAVLRLKLSIDARGRVVAVDPIGVADPAFLASARRHLLAQWRYRPATEDGRAIASSTTITLRFELD